MYENIKGISVKGKCFSSATPIEFFPNANVRLTLVYGKNGAGKTTLSEAFSAYKNQNASGQFSVSLLSLDGNLIKMGDKRKDNIFVFDEKYVDNNIRFIGDGLGTIVLIGEQVDLEEKIANQLKTVGDIEELLKEQNQICEEYYDIRNEKSPRKWYITIQSKLKGRGSWAEIDSRIKGSRQNSAVTDAVTKEICKLKCDKDQQTVKSEFLKAKTLYEQAGDTEKDYNKEAVPFAWQANIEKKILVALSRKIERPELNERDKKILEILEQKGQSRINEIQEAMADPNVKYCPYCFRPIDEPTKIELGQQISLILSKEVESHQQELSALLLTELVWDPVAYEGVDPLIENAILMKIMEINTLIGHYNKEIRAKCENVYEPRTFQDLGIETKVAEANNLIRQLEEKRIALQMAIKSRTKLKNTLIILNKQLAHYSIVADYEKYKEQVVQMNIEKGKKSELENRLSEAKAVLSNLESKRKNVQIAVDNINHSLQYIFFCKDRFTLQVADTFYQLESNGAPVKPEDISSGERNIIALSYFFTEILRNLELKTAYQREVFLVIDDPISSFDKENRIGIISFLKYQLKRILTGNINSKVVLLSHDLSAIYDFAHMAEEIKDASDQIYGKGKTNFQLCELKNFQIADFLYRKRNEYSQLMGKIYTFATGNSSCDDSAIGNVMRRVMEAFSTFESQVYNASATEKGRCNNSENPVKW